MTDGQQPLGGGRPGSAIAAYETDGAIQIVAEHILHVVVHSDYVGELWESFPEIGEHDWQRVMEAMIGRCPAPSGIEFRKAYAYLQERAELEEGPQ